MRSGRRLSRRPPLPKTDADPGHRNEQAAHITDIADYDSPGALSQQVMQPTNIIFEGVKKLPSSELQLGWDRCALNPFGSDISLRELALRRCEFSRHPRCTRLLELRK